MNPHFKLDEICISSPCFARWETMAGDDRSRFCGQCQKHVYNFSTMSRAEAEQLIREKEGRLCGRFYRRIDGTILTTDCPSKHSRSRRQITKLGGAVIAFLLFLLNGCARNSTPKVTPISSAPHGRKEQFITMGAICIPPPTTNQPTGDKSAPK
jgi:hypothetical protein